MIHGTYKIGRIRRLFLRKKGVVFTLLRKVSPIAREWLFPVVYHQSHPLHFQDR